MQTSPTMVIYLQHMAPYAAFAALVLALVAVFFIIMVSWRLERLSVGSSGSLEDTLSRLSHDVKELQMFRTELEVYLKTAEVRLHSSLRGTGVVRFNAFSSTGAGGNQSFAIALLDEKHSGVVFSALYTRDYVGVYAKPLQDGKSTFILSDEEQDAVKKAVASLGQKRISEK